MTINTARSRHQAAASTAACGEDVPVDARVSAVSVFEDLPTAVYGVFDVRRSLNVFAWPRLRIKRPTALYHGTVVGPMQSHFSPPCGPAA
jgi:hypothetical protein